MLFSRNHRLSIKKKNQCQISDTSTGLLARNMPKTTTKNNNILVTENTEIKFILEGATRLLRVKSA